MKTSTRISIFLIFNFTFLILVSSLSSAQSLYGLTFSGGTNDNGTLFRCTTQGTLSTLVNFNDTNGADPNGSLIQASDSNLYGMTYGGGQYGFGTIFQFNINTGWLTTIYSFDSVHGSYPYGSLIQGKDGYLYGMTYWGGAGDSGTLFKCTLTGTLTKLIDFNGDNGAYPRGNLMQADNGLLYGMTQQGGTLGYGTLFKCTTTGTLTTLLSFVKTNGAYPCGSLMQASNGFLYGMTEWAGDSAYAGTLFQYDTAKTNVNTLVRFNDTNGSGPYGSLLQAKDGNLYGMTSGSLSISNSGSLFKCGLLGPLDTLFSFTGNNGETPYGDLIQGADTNLYGMTSGGGTSGYGTLFKCNTSGVLDTVVNFNGTNGSSPFGNLLEVFTPTSINNLTAQNNFIKVYPNPATTEITVESSVNIPIAIGNRSPVAVYNVMGEKIYSNSFLIFHSSFLIDLSGYAPGMYFVQVVTDKGTQTVKFIKQ